MKTGNIKQMLLNEAAGATVNEDKGNRSRNLEVARESSTVDEKTNVLGYSDDKYISDALNIEV